MARRRAARPLARAPLLDTSGCVIAFGFALVERKASVNFAGAPRAAEWGGSRFLFPSRPVLTVTLTTSHVTSHKNESTGTYDLLHALQRALATDCNARDTRRDRRPRHCHELQLPV